MKKNALFISIDGMTDPLGQSQVIPYLQGLSRNGYEIDILSLEKPSSFDVNMEKIEKILSSSGISWHPVNYSSGIPLVSQYFNFRKLRLKAEQLQKKKRYSIIHCRNYLAGIIGLYLKRNYKAKFLFDMRGFWADERIDGGIWKLTNPIHERIYHFFKRKELEMLKEADHIISLTQKAKEEFSNWPYFENTTLPVSVIPCCVDTELFSISGVSPSRQEEFTSALGLKKSNFILAYLGSLGTWYMADEMLFFFKKLLEKKNNAKFLIITPDDETIVHDLLKKHGIDRSQICVTKADRKDVPTLLSLSDLCIYFIKPLYSKMASSPTKLGEILALGKPVITNSGIGDCDEIIGDKKGGILIQDFSEATFNKAIDSIDPILLTDPAHFRSLALDLFSLDKGIRQYLSVYNKLTL